MFKDKTLLITGGTGSFGNAVLNRILTTDIGEIRIFSRDEKKQDDMRKKFKSKKIKFYIGDIRDFSAVNNAVRNVDYIFHAAALKQVPSCEFYPLEAIKTNILGTENLLEAANNNNIKKVVCLSTDKAVYPINAMGISKALMEKVAISKSLTSQNNTIVCVTRYGNVLASRGSVIPLMINQIKKKLPITITDPNMTRFIMPMQKAIELVLFAIKNGKNGDIFVLDEINLADDAVIERLNSVLESGREITLAEKAGYKNQIVKAHPEFRIVGTMNPSGDYGKRELSPALRSRFTEIWIPSLVSEEDVVPVLSELLADLSPIVNTSLISKSLLDTREMLERRFHTELIETKSIISLREVITWINFIVYWENDITIKSQGV